ncbi:hypothetical protein RZP82_19205, partial [Escherichia coli]|uniref:hypothetical protein n=1 Tax=Escherichia coli TaxID=562 RepID=UPI00292B76ED
RAYCLKTQPATGATYPKSDLFNKAPWVHKCAPFFCDLPQIENEYSPAINLVENSYPSPLFQSLDCEDFL